MQSNKNTILLILHDLIDTQELHLTKGERLQIHILSSENICQRESEYGRVLAYFRYIILTIWH